jgi:hypothetical protein
MKSRRSGLLAVTLLLIILLTSCSGVEEHLWLRSPGWSRAVFIGGTSTRSPVPMLLRADGDVYALLSETGGEPPISALNLVRFAPGTGSLNLVPLDIPLQFPRQLDMLWEDGDLRLYWIDRESLYTARVATGGSVLEDPVLLSGTDTVGSFSLARSQDGKTSLWYAGTRVDPGIAMLPFAESDKAIQIDEQGIRIQTMVDQTGVLHASWVYHPYGYETTRIRYAAYGPRGDAEALQVQEVQRLRLGTSTTLDDFALGLDEEQIYFFWTTIVRSGLQSGTIMSQYVTFPIGGVISEARPREIWVPALSNLDFTNTPGGFKVGERVSLPAPEYPLTNELQDISANPVVDDETVVVFRSPAQHLWRKTRLQVNLVYMRAGEPFAYQPLSYTPTAPSFPNLVSSADDHLYVTWLEKQEDNWFSVYLAGTEPVMVASLDELTLAEIGDIALESSFGMLIGALLAPIAAAVWMIAPLLVLLLFSPLGRIRSEKASNVVTVISLVVAVGLVWATKMAVFPAMFEYVPFSAWIPEIPATAGLALQVLVPVITLVVSSYTAWHFTFRQGNYSSLYFILVYIGVDALFTTSIYAVLIYGTYIQ